MPVSDATKPDEAAMTAAAPTASTERRSTLRPGQERRDWERREELDAECIGQLQLELDQKR
jgi:hypothetical protein